MSDEATDTPWWAGIVGALILLTVFTVIALVAAGGWQWFAEFLAGSAAAWVQAIGSIAAIVSGIGVINWQVKQQAKEAREHTNRLEVERLRIVYFMLFNARAQLSEVQEAAKWERSVSESLGRFKHYVDRLGNLPMFEVPSCTVVQVIHMAQQVAQTVPDILSASDAWFNRATLLNREVSNFRAYESVVKVNLEALGATTPDIHIQIDGRYYSSRS